jgi:hypothetical protein
MASPAGLGRVDVCRFTVASVGTRKGDQVMSDELKGCVPNLRKLFRKTDAGTWEEVEPMGVRKGDVVRFEDSDEELVTSSDSYREPLGPPEEPFASWVPAFQFETPNDG